MPLDVSRQPDETENSLNTILEPLIRAAHSILILFWRLSFLSI